MLPTPGFSTRRVLPQTNLLFCACFTSPRTAKARFLRCGCRLRQDESDRRERESARKNQVAQTQSFVPRQLDEESSLLSRIIQLQYDANS